MPRLSLNSLRSPLPGLNDATRPRAVAAAAAFLILYPLLAAASGRFSAGGTVSPWYPAAGLGLAFLVGAGARCAPLLFGAILLGAALGGRSALAPGALILLALAKTAVWAGVAAVLRRPWRYPDPWHPGNALRVLMLGLAAPAPLAALTVWMMGSSPLDQGRSAAIALWLGDANSVLSVAPLALLLLTFVLGRPWTRNTPAVPRWGAWPIGVIVAQAATVVAVIAVARAAGPEAGAERHYLYFVPLVWSALRWGLGGAAVTALALNLGAVLAEPAALRATHSGMSELMVFLLGLSGSGLLLGAVTSARAREQARSQRRARQLEAAELVSDTGSWEWEVGTDRVWWSAGVRRLLAVPADEPASLEGFLARVHAQDAPRLRAHVQRVAAEGGEFDDEVRLNVPGGGIRYLAVRGALRPDRGGGLRLTASCQDRTEQREAEARERHAARHDPLTGLPNRAHLLERLEHAEPGYVVLLAEVDRLEAVNDSLGHRAGDEIIAVVAERLGGSVNGDGMVARLGGGEFALLLRGDAASAESRARRVIEALGDPVPLAGGEVLPGGRVGAALGTPGISAEEVLRQARTALFHARHAGRDRFALFEPRMQAAAAERLRLVGELHRAISAGELCMAYQPVVSLRSGAPRAVEALLRWRHPRRGMLMAGTFVPAAEEAGLMGMVDEWGLDTACHEFQGTLERDAGVLAVNVSAREAAHPRFRAVVESALERSGLAPARLMVEVTESVLLDDTEAAASSLRALAQLGVGIALDDFGSGYSSLRYLHRFPVAAVKIDRSFVEHIEGDPRSQAVVRAVLAVAKSIGAATVAEGIETASQERMLREMGCAYAQGFRYSPGLLGAEAATWLAAHRGASRGEALVPPVTDSPPLPV